MKHRLSVQNHDRDSAGLKYVYPVVSRRARGVSLGINLNPNNACNFRCVYCQVPDLIAGKGPEIDLGRLERELRQMLSEIMGGDFMQRVPEHCRRLNDIAFSGNGEPTSSPQFQQSVALLLDVLADYDIDPDLKLVLITNGSLTDRPAVEAGIERLATLNGEVWFKLDSATPQGALRVNSSAGSLTARLARLRRVAKVCPTWIQSCWFRTHGADPNPLEVEAFLELIAQLRRDGVPLSGVLLYGLARPSFQPEAATLSPVEGLWLEDFGQRIRALDIPVQVSV